MTRLLSSPSAQFAAALAALLLAVAGYGIWHARVAALSANVASLDAQIQTASESALRLSSARAALAQLSGDETAVHNYFVSESQVVSFIDALQSLGSSLGATVKVDSVSAASVAGHPALVVALSLAGSFDAIMRTVGALEFAPYDLTISTLSVAKDPTTGWSANVTLAVGSVAGAAMSAPAVAQPSSAAPASASKGPTPTP